jgi:hypothetical protein
MGEAGPEKQAVGVVVFTKSGHGIKSAAALYFDE